jgi:hypothetical protein
VHKKYLVSESHTFVENQLNCCEVRKVDDDTYIHTYIHTNAFHRSIIHSRWHEYEIGHKEERERTKTKKRKMI